MTLRKQVGICISRAMAPINKGPGRRKQCVRAPKKYLLHTTLYYSVLAYISKHEITLLWGKELRRTASWTRLQFIKGENQTGEFKVWLIFYFLLQNLYKKFPYCVLIAGDMDCHEYNTGIHSLNNDLTSDDEEDDLLVALVAELIL